jgi:PilZ domain-containing protein
MPDANSSDRILDRRRQLRAHGPDRRHHRRVSVDLYMNRFLDGQPYLCRMVDMSRTGARLLPTIEPDGDRAPQLMGLQFQIPGREEIFTASGETVSRRGRTVGIRFTNLPPDAAWAIESFLTFGS